MLWSDDINYENAEADNFVPSPLEGKKHTKRGRPKGFKVAKGGKKGYFYEEEERAVADYIAAETKAEKERIFVTYLKPAFTTMIESIIRRYGLYPPDEEFDENFSDTMSFLMMKLDNFNPQKGRAFSYSQTICKNYLIYKVNTYKKNEKRSLCLDSGQPDATMEDDKFLYTIDDDKTEVFNRTINLTVRKIQSMIDSDSGMTQNDIKVGASLIDILTHIDDYFPLINSNKFNKSSFFRKVEDYTLLREKEIKLSMKKFKLIYFSEKLSIINE